MEEPQNSATAQVMVNCLKSEKEAFWFENQFLPEEQIQQRWLKRTAELKRQLSSVLEATPPLQQNNLTLDSVPKATSQQDLSYSQTAPNMVRDPSVCCQETDA